MTRPRPLRCVVVGIDGSPTADEALRWAANRMVPDGVLHVVHVADDGPRDTTWLRELVRTVDGPEQTTVVAGRGVPDRVLVEQAAELDAQMLVVGAHGTGRRRRWAPFIGSVTRDLLHHSDLPIVVHHGETRPTGGPVVAGVGYGPSADAVVDWAATYAQASSLPLELIHAVSRRPVYPIDSPTDVLGSYLGPGVDKGWAAEDLAQRSTGLAQTHPGLANSTTVVSGSAVKAIIEAAQVEERRAELVVLGRPSSAAAEYLPIGVRTRQVISRVGCPTAVVPSCGPLS